MNIFFIILSSALMFFNLYIMYFNFFVKMLFPFYSLRGLTLYNFYNTKNVTAFPITLYQREKIFTFYAALCICQYQIDRCTYSIWIIIICFVAIFPKSSCIRSFAVTIIKIFIINIFTFQPFFSGCCNYCKQSSKEYADH